jgi:outer membrane protein assembly factor BamA
MKESIYITFLISLWLLCYPFSSVAQQLFFVENQRVSSPVKIDEAITDSLLLKSYQTQLNKELNDRGYFNMHTDSIVTTSNSTYFYITIGNRSTFQAIKNSNGADYCKDLIDQYFSTIDLSHCMDKISSMLTAEGYPFNSVTVDGITIIDGQYISVRIQKDSGNQVSISNIVFFNNHTLSDWYLQRVVRWNGPVLFNPDRLDSWLQQLNANTFLNDARFYGISEQEGNYFAMYHVQEISRSDIDLIIGVEPNSERGSRLTGQGKLRLNHVIIPGSRLDAEIRRLPNANSNLGLNYKQEWISRHPIGIHVGLHFSQVDSSYLMWNSNLSGSWLYDAYNTIGINLVYKGSTGLSIGDKQFQLDHRYAGVGIFYQLNSTNSRLTPTKGMDVYLEIERGFTDLSKQHEIKSIPVGYYVNTMEFSLKSYLPLSDKTILVPSIKVYHAIHSFYMDGDLHRFGGTYSIRGYREDQFRVSSYVWGDLETRWMLDRTSYIFGFLSLAQLQYPVQLGILNPRKATDMVYSGGFGLSYKVRPGMFKLSYALSKNDSWLNGKIHIGLINSF